MSDHSQADHTLEDRQQVYELVLRYCRAVDRGDLQGVRSVYHENAIEHHHTAFEGPIDGYISWLAETLPDFDGMMHFVGNHLSTFAGERAVAETYAMGIHWGGDPDDARNFTSGVRYIDYLERRGGQWGIVERWAVRDWLRSDVGRRLPIGKPISDVHDERGPFEQAMNRLQQIEVD